MFFLKSANRKSASSWAQSEVANLQISEVYRMRGRKFKTRKILLINPKTANPQISLVSPQILKITTF
jgi:hypothetical protein